MRLSVALNGGLPGDALDAARFIYFIFLFLGLNREFSVHCSLTDAPAAGETMWLSVAVNGSLPCDALDAARPVPDEHKTLTGVFFPLLAA